MVLADEVLLGWVSRDTQQDQTGTGLTIFRNWRRDMTINPNFPLSLQDQADVIRGSEHPKGAINDPLWPAGEEQLARGAAPYQ